MIGAASSPSGRRNNIRSDLWAMEHMKHTQLLEFIPDADDQYHRYEEDIGSSSDAAGLNAYIFRSNGASSRRRRV